MKAKIKVENNMYYAVKQNPRHIWVVKFNPANGIYFITNERTQVTYEAMAADFVYGNNYGSKNLANLVPGYIHDYVWMIAACHFEQRIASRRVNK